MKSAILYLEEEEEEYDEKEDIDDNSDDDDDSYNLLTCSRILRRPGTHLAKP